MRNKGRIEYNAPFSFSTTGSVVAKGSVVRLMCRWSRSDSLGSWEKFLTLWVTILP